MNALCDTKPTVRQVTLKVNGGPGDWKSGRGIMRDVWRSFNSLVVVNIEREWFNRRWTTLFRLMRKDYLLMSMTS